MDIDNYINNLSSDLERQMQELNRSMNAALNMDATSTAANVSDMNMGGASFCPECGTRLEAGTRFCPQCGTRIEDNANNEDTYERPACEPADNSSQPVLPRHGFLFTDTMALAEKYGCERGEVVEIFNDILQGMLDFGMDWQLLDAAEYRPQLGKAPFWLDYNQLISDFMEDNGYQYGMKTPVFIIGGDDVIPIPKVEDTFGTSDDGQMPCDMCYCFTGNFFSDLWDGDHTISERDVRNVVSRLPLEDGEMDTSIEDDIQEYFNRCMDYYEEGIPVENVMMTANASWLPASKTMSEHLPLIEHAADEKMVKYGMYVSPPVTPDNEEAETPLELSLGDAGMLLFNLHGAGQEGMSSFYSDEGEAFNIQMLTNSQGRVFNTVACYGARYHGYERNDSMLLSSIHDFGFLLYAGSLIPVPMTELNVPEGIEVHEGSGSEHLMPIYCMEQYRGLPVGEAMMKAKLEYFNTFRHMERDDFSMATMQMFAVYGHPALFVQHNEDVLRKAEEMHVLPQLPQSSKSWKDGMPVRMKRLQRISGSGSLLADIRGAVNANLDAIHSAIANGLYAQLGLEPRMLHHIDAYSIPNGDGSVEKGFMYAYVNEDRAFANKTWVEVDESGKLKRIFKTK